MERLLREATFELDDDDIEALGQRFESDDDFSEARARPVVYSRSRAGTASTSQINLLTKRVNVQRTQIRTLQTNAKKQQQKFQVIGMVILFFILRKPGGILSSGSTGGSLFSLAPLAAPPPAGGGAGAPAAAAAPAGGGGAIAIGQRGTATLDITELLIIGLGIYLISDPAGSGGDDKGSMSSMLSNPIVLLLLLEFLVPRPG